jgi:hypothetical protein
MALAATASSEPSRPLLFVRPCFIKHENLIIMFLLQLEVSLAPHLFFVELVL